MSLSLRQRGRNKIWYARGTVRIGRNQTVAVREFNTGCVSKTDAKAVAEREERRIRDEATHGPTDRAKRTVITTLLTAYVERPGGVRQYDKDRLEDIAKQIGHRPVDDAPAAWGDWLAVRGKDMQPSTAARWRSVFQAALVYGAAAKQIQAPKIPTISVRTHEKAVYLSHEAQTRLLDAYSKHARQVAYVLCYQGLRTSEALSLEWPHVDFERNTLFVAKTKTRKQRTVPMHPTIRKRLRWLWISRARPKEGRVFLSSRGDGYAVNTEIGGNPLTKAHTTACIKAGLCEPSGRKTADGRDIMRVTFRLHDWRHHFASNMVMSGCNLSTLMRMGGWESAKMVQRYASVSVDHMAEAIGRLK